MNSNVRAFPQVMPPQPQQQDWVWDGARWCEPGCGPPPPCPPPGFPTPCPPWFPPPAGQAPWYPGANGGVFFSQNPPANPTRGSFWWDGLMLHLFDGAAWVTIGPQTAGAGGGAFVGTSPPPNPAVGTLWWNGTVMQVWDGTQFNPIYGKGVTDGSVAAPGIIGELLSQTSTGSVTDNAPVATFAALALTAGDWDVEGAMTISDNTLGTYIDIMSFGIANGSTTLSSFQITGQFQLSAGGFGGGTFDCMAFGISVAATTTLTGTIQVTHISGGPPGSANYKFICTGRRRR